MAQSLSPNLKGSLTGSQIKFHIRYSSRTRLQAVGYKKQDTAIFAPCLSLLKRPHINLSLHSSYKEDTPPEIFLNKFYELCDEQRFLSIIHRGSLVGEPSACAVVSRTSCESVRLPNNTSIFWAELHAIMLAMRLIRKRKEQNFIIFSDSMSSLQALNGFKLELDLIQMISKDYSHLTAIGKTVMLCWIPSHVYTGKRKSWLCSKIHIISSYQ